MLLVNTKYFLLVKNPVSFDLRPMAVLGTKLFCQQDITAIHGAKSKQAAGV